MELHLGWLKGAFQKYCKCSSGESTAERCRSYILFADVPNAIYIRMKYSLMVLMGYVYCYCPVPAVHGSFPTLMHSSIDVMVCVCRHYAYIVMSYMERR